MPDKKFDAPETSNNSNAAQASPTPSPSPPIKGNKNGTGRNGENGSDNNINKKDGPPHWTGYIEAICAILLVLITAAYTYYASQQTCATIKAANAAKSAADTAAASLKLSSDQFNASQAAVLQPAIHIEHQPTTPAHSGNPTVADTAYFIQIEIFNGGRNAATNVSADISTTPNYGRKSIKGRTVLATSPSPYYKSGFITVSLPLKTISGPPIINSPVKEGTKAFINLRYWNGTEEKRSNFCYAFRSDFESVPDWPECDYAEGFQKH